MIKGSNIDYSYGVISRSKVSLNSATKASFPPKASVYITLALKQGMPHVTLIKITGHKDLRTMQKYVRITEENTYNAIGVKVH
jgi:hypothetical protein